MTGNEKEDVPALTKQTLNDIIGTIKNIDAIAETADVSPPESLPNATHAIPTHRELDSVWVDCPECGDVRTIIRSPNPNLVYCRHCGYEWEPIEEYTQ